MNTTSMDEWLAAFRARHDLNLPLGADEVLVQERAEMAAAYAEENTPVRYADAVPSAPPVETWVADVVRAAVRDSQARGQVITSVGSGPSLLLLGVTGVGKTHEGYGAVRTISLLGVHARWLVLSAADLYARLRPRHGVDSEAEFVAIADAPVLVVDDLGAAKGSEWTEEINFRLVNRRYENARPTIFTSNVTPNALKAELGDRVASRLVGMAQMVPLKGTDRRRAA